MKTLDDIASNLPPLDRKTKRKLNNIVKSYLSTKYLGKIYVLEVRTDKNKERAIIKIYENNTEKTIIERYVKLDNNKKYGELDHLSIEILTAIIATEKKTKKKLYTIYLASTEGQYR